MATIETSYLNNPYDSARCELHTDGQITIIDSQDKEINLGPNSVLNLLDFLSGWHSAFKIARDKEEKERTSNP